MTEQVYHFVYRKGDRWTTAIWLECVRCGAGIAPGSKVVAKSASLRYGPQIVHETCPPEERDPAVDYRVYEGDDEREIMGY